MSRFIIAVLLLFFSVFFILTNFAYADNLTNASDTINNSRLSYSSGKNIETAIHKISFESQTTLQNGSILVVLPAAASTSISNDGLPDTGQDIRDSGFDLNGLRPENITCEGADLIWSQSLIKDAAKSDTGEHEIYCNFKGILNAGETITIIIGDKNKQLINPSTVTNHKAGTADVYNLDVRLLDKNTNTIDRVYVKTAFIESILASSGVEVKVVVGKNKFKLFGFTSAKAIVYLDGISIKEKTIADAKGYFEFSSANSPLLAQETCLYSQDSLGRVTSPACLASFPIDIDVEIGPVILSPTISLSKALFQTGQNGILSGQTIPNTEVDLTFFVDNNASSLSKLNPIKKVLAFSIPKISVRSDKQGNYSISLPTNEESKVRTFAQYNYNNSPSPKSFTLSFLVTNWWDALIITLLYYVGNLMPYLLMLLALITITLILLMIYRHHFHPAKLINSRALMIRERFPLLVEN